MLLPRVLTAIVGIPVLIFLIHWGGLPYALFIVGVVALALHEYETVLSIGGRSPQRVMTILSGSALALCLAVGGPIGLVLSASVAAMLLLEMFSREHSLDRMALTLLGAVVFGWMLGHLVLIRELRPDGEKITFMLFVAVWIMDTAAYAVGKTLGRHKLAAVISPKKTWEGAAGGFAAALIFVMGYRAAALRETLTVGQAAGLGVLIGISGQLSDLAESMIKRAVGCKDSGNLLPGHGGLMDRFDSFILSAPIVYYYLSLVL